uniref:Uncharacterized protein n=1 Tax=Anguilla anguilla TaxID=7936 RepID=A0A0E9U9B0_ANGAN
MASAAVALFSLSFLINVVLWENAFHDVRKIANSCYKTYKGPETCNC